MPKIDMPDEMFFLVMNVALQGGKLPRATRENIIRDWNAQAAREMMVKARADAEARAASEARAADAAKADFDKAAAEAEARAEAARAAEASKRSIVGAAAAEQGAGP